MLGGALRESSARAAAAFAIGATALTLDQLGPWFPHGNAARIAIGLAATAALLALARGDRESVGLRFAPAQGWRWWLKATLVVGVVFGMALVAWFALEWALKGSVDVVRAPYSLDLADVVHGLLVAPLVEEPLYRVALCVPLAALVDRRIAIVASGVAFALLHVRYGNAGPTNMLAGFVLGWAFVKSRSLALPMLLHALGNACVFTWWRLHGA